MKTLFTVLASLFLSSFAVGAVQQKGRTVEIEVEKVFVPHSGYNDNNAVELVVQGELPNPCFTLGETRVEKSAGGKLAIRQMAWQRLTGACDTGDLIDDPIPFTAVVPLGRIEAASYQISYRTEFGKTGRRAFDVAPALNDEIDEFHYTITRGVGAKEFYREGETVELTLKGFIPSPCYKLIEPVKTEVQDDVVVVWPVLQTLSGVECNYELAEYSHTFTVPNLKAGSYLVHARSRGGDAVYQGFRVAKKK